MPRLTRLHPAAGPNRPPLDVGQTQLRVFGTGFVDSATDIHCHFAHGDKVDTVEADYMAPSEQDGESVSCLVPETSSVGEVEVSVSNKEHGARSPALAYFYYVSPEVRTLAPDAGPIKGGTRILVTGKGFAGDGWGRKSAFRDYSCNFGAARRTPATFISDTRLICESPRLDVEDQAETVTVTLNGVDSSGRVKGVKQPSFFFFAQPDIDTLFPSRGPVYGGTEIRVEGGPFLDLPGRTSDDHTRCAFDGVPSVDTSLYESRAIVHCKTPASVQERPLWVEVQVTMNDQQWTDIRPSLGHANLFQYYMSPFILSLVPRAGAVGGLEPIRVHGTGFLDTGDALLVRFGEGSWQDTLGVHPICAVRASAHSDAWVWASSCSPDSISNRTALRVSAGELLVRTPPRGHSGNVQVHVSLNGAITPSAASANNGRGAAAYGADYTFFEEPKIAKVTPPCGPVDQLVQLSVLGEGFTERTPGSIHCKFPLPGTGKDGKGGKGDSKDNKNGKDGKPVFRTVTATVVDDDDTELRCSVPRLGDDEEVGKDALGKAPLTMEVVLAAQEEATEGLFLAKAEYLPYEQVVIREIVPASAPVGTTPKGSKTVKLHGEGFHNGKQSKACALLRLTCLFGQERTDGRIIDDKTAECDIPTVAVAEVTFLEVSINGGAQYTDQRLPFVFFDAPRILSLLPDTAPATGNVEVAVVGNGFEGVHGIRDVYCRFGSAAPTRAVSATGDSLLCTVPAGHGGDIVRVAVSLNGPGGNFVEGQTSFGRLRYYATPVIRQFENNDDSGPPEGGTVDALLGSGFDSAFKGVAALVKAQGGGHAGAPVPGLHLDYSSIRVRFGDMVVQPTVQRTDASRISLVIPATSRPTVVPVEVALNGHHFLKTSGLEYTYMNTYVISVVPPYGPSKDASRVSARVTVKGYGFINNGKLLCVFECPAPAHASEKCASECTERTSDGGKRRCLRDTAAAYVDNEHLTCDVPEALSAGMAYTTVEVEGRVDKGSDAKKTGNTHYMPLTANKVQFRYVSPWELTGFAPTSATSGSASGGAQVEILGKRMFDLSVGSPTQSAAVGAPACRFTRAASPSAHDAQPVSRAYVSVDGTKCVCILPAFHAVSHTIEKIHVAVAMNGVSFVDVPGGLFTVFPAPAVTALEPKCGPMTGGARRVVVHGANLKPADSGNVRVRWALTDATKHDDMIVAPPKHAIGATRINTTVPGARDESHIAVEVAVDGGHTWTNTKHTYSFYRTPEIRYVDPASGPASLGSPVRVFGYSFPTARERCGVVCRYGDGAPVVATYVSTTEVVCPAQAAPKGGKNHVVDLEVSFNGGVDYTTNGMKFMWYQQPSVAAVSPTSGPRTGGTLLEVHGEGFFYTANLICKFGTGPCKGASAVCTPAVLRSSTVLQCVTPQWDYSATDSHWRGNGGDGPVGTVPLTISQNGHDFTAPTEGKRALLSSSSGLMFSFYRIDRMFPLMGPRHTARGVTLSGAGFAASSNATCRYGASCPPRDGVPCEPQAVFESSHSLRCPFPKDVKDGDFEEQKAKKGYMDIWVFLNRWDYFPTSDDMRGMVVGKDGAVEDLSVMGITVQYAFYPDPSLYSVDLASGPASSAGQALLRVTGDGFFERLKRFSCGPAGRDACPDNDLAARASTIVCRFTPGRKVAGDGASAAVAKAGADVGAAGGAVDIPGTYVSTTVITCPMPRLSEDAAKVVYHVSVSLNAFDFTHMRGGSDAFSAYGVRQVSPQALSRQADAGITVSGFNFGSPDSAVEVRCRIGGGVSVATYVSSQVMRCPLPKEEVALGGERVVTVEIAVNGRDFTNDGHNVTLYDPPTVAAGAVEPASGRVEGGTVVRVKGHGFEKGEEFHYRCRFVSQQRSTDRAEVDAYFVNSKEIRCISPPNPSLKATSMYVEVSLNGRQYTNQQAALFTYGGRGTPTGGMGPGAIVALVLAGVVVVVLCGVFAWWQSKGTSQWQHSAHSNGHATASSLPVHSSAKPTKGRVQRSLYNPMDHGHHLELTTSHAGVVSYEDD